MLLSGLVVLGGLALLLALAVVGPYFDVLQVPLRWPWVTRRRLDAAVRELTERYQYVCRRLDVARTECSDLWVALDIARRVREQAGQEVQAARWEVAAERDRAKEAGRLYAEQAREAARWRQRALDAEGNGPTCADVQAVYEENARLRAQLAAQIGGGVIPPVHP